MFINENKKITPASIKKPKLQVGALFGKIKKLIEPLMP